MVEQSEVLNLTNKTAHIRIIPLDMDKLNADIDKDIKAELEKGKDSALVPKLEANEVFYTNGPLGLIVGTKIVIDNNCVGSIVSEKVTLDIYSQIVIDGQIKEFGLMPRFTIKMTIDELIADYALPEIDLPRFMGDRFAYNDRVCRNIYTIIKTVNAK